MSAPSISELSGLKAHHFACLTKNIKDSIGVYKILGFNKVSEIYHIAGQEVNVCFIEIGENIFLELVEFNEENNPALAKIFKSRNPYYHVGYLVKDMEDTISFLRNQRFYLVNKFHSPAFNEKLCAFLYSPEMHLIELIEE